MKLAFSTNAFVRFPLGDALAMIRDAGFEAVEILADVPHAYPPAITPALTAQVSRELSRLGLSVSNVNCNCSFGYWKHAPPEPYFEPSLISPVERYRADRQKMILDAIEFAKAIGSSSISITSGRCLGGVAPDRASVLLVEGLRPILDAADAAGVDVGIELEPGLFLEWVDELVDWIGRLGHPRFGANLDIGHSVVMGESVEAAVTSLAGRIWNLHVEDLPGRKHYHMIPGEGTFDWLALRSALRGIGYRRSMTVELYTQTADPLEAARRSHAFLSRVFGGSGSGGTGGGEAQA